MKENEDKNLDELAKKVISRSRLDTPSVNFTNRIMSQIDALNSTNAIAYQPLISKRVWAILAILFTCIMSYIIYYNSGSSSIWFDSLDFNIVNLDKFTSLLSGISISQTLSYTIGIFALMICVQVTYLKHHFNKRFEA